MDELDLASLLYPMPLVRRNAGRPIADQFKENFNFWCRDLDHVNPTFNFTISHYQSAWTYIVARCAKMVDRSYLLTNYPDLDHTIFRQELQVVQERAYKEQPSTLAQWQAALITSYQRKISALEKRGDVNGLRAAQEAWSKPKKRTVRLDSGAKVDVSKQYDPKNFKGLSSELPEDIFKDQLQMQLHPIENNEPQNKRRGRDQTGNSSDEDGLPKKKKWRCHKTKRNKECSQSPELPSRASATAANTVQLPFNRLTSAGNDGSNQSENHHGLSSSTIYRDLKASGPSLHYPSIEFMYGGIEGKQYGEMLAEATALPPSHDGLPISHDGQFGFYTSLSQVETQIEPHVKPQFESHIESFIEPQIERQVEVEFDTLPPPYDAHFRFYPPIKNRMIQEEPLGSLKYDAVPQDPRFDFYTARHEEEREVIQFGGNLYVGGDIHVRGDVHVGGDEHFSTGSHEHLQESLDKENARAGKRNGKGEKCAAHKDGDVIGAAAPELGLDNKGRRMLEKMGWMAGTGLGCGTNQGILDPLGAVIKSTRAGLGGVE